MSEKDAPSEHADNDQGENQRLGPWEPNRNLTWLHLWNHSPAISQMWSQIADHMAAHGGVREIQWKGPESGGLGAVAMSVGYDPLGARTNPSAPITSEGDAFLHTVPLIPTEDLKLSWMFGSILPWQAPALTGINGAPTGEPDIRRLAFAFEWPVPYFLSERLGATLSKTERERLHLDQYFTDHLIANGRLPYEGAVKPEQPPRPDFVINEGSDARGIDCVQLALPTRRGAHGSFRAIRDAVLQQPRQRFVHLAGSMIYVWFERENQLVRPCRAGRDRAAIHHIVDALSNYKVDRDRYRTDLALEFPRQHPGWTTEQMEAGGIFYGVPLQGYPSTRFFMSTGFELGLAFTSIADAASGWKSLIELLESHDQPGFDHLLVTVGGPDEAGFGYLAEELLLIEMLRDPKDIPKPRYVTKVTLHSWETGEIVDLKWGPDPKQSFPDEMILNRVNGRIRPSSIQVLPVESSL